MEHTSTLSVDISYDGQYPPLRLMQALHAMVGDFMLDGSEDPTVESKASGEGWKLHWLKEEA